MRVVSLTDDELSLVMAACRPLPVEERDNFLRLLAAELAQHRDLTRAIRSAIEASTVAAGLPAA